MADFFGFFTCKNFLPVSARQALNRLCPGDVSLTSKKQVVWLDSFRRKTRSRFCRKQSPFIYHYRKIFGATALKAACSTGNTMVAFA
jgi:hypothetical protein